MPSCVPQDTSEVPSLGRPYLIPVTSSSPDAAGAAIEGLTSYLQDDDYPNVASLATMMSAQGPLHRWRTFAIGRDASSVAAELKKPRAVARWKESPEVVPRIGFVFTGQGSQAPCMGLELLHCSSVFRDSIRQCDTALRDLEDSPDWTIEEELARDKSESRIMETEYSQPICAALQISLVNLLRSWNITADAVCGHSSGEIAASYAADLITLNQAMAIAFYRGKYMASLAAGARLGGMMAVDLSEAECLTVLESFKRRLSIAAINSPLSTTVSGDLDAIDELNDVLEEKDIFHRKLQVKQAFHSIHMLPAVAPYEDKLSGCLGNVNPGRLEGLTRMVSSVTVEDLSSFDMKPIYWSEHMMRPVRFKHALEEMVLPKTSSSAAIDVLLEIGPHPALKGPCREVLQAAGLKLPYFATQTRGKPAYESALEAAGQLFAVQYPVDLPTVNGAQDGPSKRIEALKHASLDNRPAFTRLSLANIT